MKFKALQIIGTLFLYAYFSNFCFGQPNFIYEGGGGDTYASYSYEEGVKYLHEGGDSDGYAEFTFNEACAYLFEGGDKDGYAVYNYNFFAPYLFEGGDEDGHAQYDYKHLAPHLFEGGDDDGYSFFYHIEPFIWTGAVGQSWTVAGNWNHNRVPGIFRKTIIPAGVPAYPHINAGLFAIGANPNNGVFKSGELWIQAGALLVTRVNNRIENYGLITIDGTINIKRLNPNAFQNIGDGEIIINTGGELKFN